MERFRQRRSKVAGHGDRSSGRGLFFADAASRQGNRQIQKQRSQFKLAPDCSSYPNGFTEDNLLNFEMGHSKTDRLTGTPMKKLLAEEMLKETESKRRPPSIIARLMGLDGLPPQQATQKQHKRFPEKFQQRTASTGSQRNCVSYDGSHQRKSSKEQQEFKDVFEVVETPRADSSSVLLHETESSKCAEAKMEFIRQKFMDAKRFSTDEKLQDSEEFYDALKVLESNKDLLLKFLQEPDSLFTKHLHDMKGSPPQSHCNHLPVIRSANARKFEKNLKGSKSVRETSCKSDTSSPQRYHDVRSLKFRDQIGGKDKIDVQPTKIVVLKPNVGKTQDAGKFVSSPHSSQASLSDYRNHVEFPIIRHGEAESPGREKLCSDMAPSRYKCGESREIAREIARRMRNGFNSGSINLSPSYIRGYAGDESSCSMSESDSANESEVATFTPRSSFDCNNFYLPSPSYSIESSVNREAKKRLSERWKITQRFQEGRVASSGSTLGEMLAIPDRETHPANLDAMDDLVDSYRNDKTAGRIDPLGISSRDGWKDGCVSDLPRSRSLPASSAAFGSPKASMRREAVGNGRYMMPKEAINKFRNNEDPRNFNQKESLYGRNTRSGNKKSRSPCRTNRESSGILLDMYFAQNQLRSNFDDKDSSNPKQMISETSGSIFSDTNSVLDQVADAGHENVTMSFEFPDNLLQEASDCMLVRVDSSSHDHDSSAPKEQSIRPSDEVSVPMGCPVPEAASPASTKEIDQPSPVSVLEAPFMEDPSSGSECFERVNADLHGLRMQLQLLKLESETYVEGPMLISSDEDVGGESVEGRRIFRAQESLESSYLVDVLSHCSFDGTDPESIVAAWHSPEYPIGPLVFEKLEKRFCDKSIWMRSERKLLFDRINSGLAEILQESLDSHPWVKPVTRRVGPRWAKGELKDELSKRLGSQGKKAKGDTAEKVPVNQSEWLNLRDDIDVIGREVERLLIDELVSEIVTVW
ncbi:uncharacterized protein LOC131160329 [Malania oleifera]|uniref:uncharacterized protein LOC131160329 n=1 Tax=Malania oleifera TaxID=397392 RepID=UPI0025AE41F1|nr:uncharacterized protein LOC131160329 [Malania oleifera]